MVSNSMIYKEDEDEIVRALLSPHISNVVNSTNKFIKKASYEQDLSTVQNCLNNF